MIINNCCSYFTKLQKTSKGCVFYRRTIRHPFQNRKKKLHQISVGFEKLIHFKFDRGHKKEVYSKMNCKTIKHQHFFHSQSRNHTVIQKPHYDKLFYSSGKILIFLNFPVFESGSI